MVNLLIYFYYFPRPLALLQLNYLFMFTSNHKLLQFLHLKSLTPSINQERTAGENLQNKSELSRLSNKTLQCPIPQRRERLYCSSWFLLWLNMAGNDGASKMCSFRHDWE